MKTARFLTTLILLAAGLTACHHAPRYANRAERLLAELADDPQIEHFTFLGAYAEA